MKPASRKRIHYDDEPFEKRSQHKDLREKIVGRSKCYDAAGAYDFIPKKKYKTTSNRRENDASSQDDLVIMQKADRIE